MTRSAVGWATVPINPPLGSPIPGQFFERHVQGIHNDVLARAVFVPGDPPLGLLVLDVIGVERPTVEALRAEAERRLGLPPERLMVAATHNHTGPPTYKIAATDSSREYLEEMVDRSVQALEEASRRAWPAELGLGAVSVPGLAFNRRYLMKDGSFRTNPGLGNPDVVRSAGPVDDTLTLLAFRPAEGGPPLLLVHFGLHLDTVGGNFISADYVYYLTYNLQHALGPDTGVALLLGPQGDINHWDVLGAPPQEAAGADHGVLSEEEGTRGEDYTPRIGRRLSEAVLDLLPDLSFSPEWPVGTTHRMLNVALRQPAPEQLDRIRETLRHKSPKELEGFQEIFDHEALLLAQSGETEVDLEIRGVRLGPAALLGIPCEVFTEIGMQIRQASPFDHTLPMSLANGTEGYLPTEQAFSEGGYETTLARSSKLSPDAEHAVVETATQVLRDLAAGA